MPKHPNASEENAAMERREWQDTRPQDRLVGRLKFTGCRECGGDFGMYSTTREEMAMFLDGNGTIERFAPWYREPGHNLVLYHPCWACNFNAQRIPNGFELLDVEDVKAWAADRDPMAPDYDALAAEKPVLASLDSRDSAGLEG